MLIGNYSSKLHAKGRTAIPKKFREELGSNLIITQGYEQCLMIVSSETWSQLVDPNKPLVHDAARNTDRFLMANAFELEPDDQGRIIIPSSLIKYANLNENIIYIGVGNRIEIWSETIWENFSQYLNQNSAKIAQSLLKDKTQSQ